MLWGTNVKLALILGLIQAALFVPVWHYAPDFFPWVLAFYIGAISANYKLER